MKKPREWAKTKRRKTLPYINIISLTESLFWRIQQDRRVNTHLQINHRETEKISSSFWSFPRNSAGGAQS